MADTYTTYFNGVAFAAAKNMAMIVNTHATETIRIYRVGLLNAQTAAVTGVLCQLELRRYTGAGLTGHTAVVPVKHDTTTPAYASSVIGHAGTPTGTPDVLRRIFWSSDEAAISTGTLDEWETMVPLNVIFDTGGDANVSPLILRQGEGICVYNTTGAAGLLDTWIESTRV